MGSYLKARLVQIAALRPSVVIFISLIKCALLLACFLIPVVIQPKPCSWLI